MDVTYMANYIDTGFFAGLLIGMGFMALMNWIKNREQSGDDKIEDEHYRDIRKIFRETNS